MAIKIIQAIEIFFVFFVFVDNVMPLKLHVCTFITCFYQGILTIA